MLERNILANLENLDYCQLPNSDDYAKYHNHLLQVLKLFLAYHERLQKEDHLNDTEITFITHWFTILLDAIATLRLKYRFTDTHAMQIDLSESGFPNYDEFENLSVDYNFAEKSISKARNQKEIKDEMLDELCNGKDVSKKLLAEMGQLNYYTLIKEKQAFSTFIKGGFQIIETNKTFIKYRTSWMYIDMATNRPNICFMEFEYHNNDDEANKEHLTENTKHLNAFWESISQKNRRTINMRLLAEQIDYELEYIHPMVVKRLDIGPLFNNYSLDNHDLTQFFKEKKFSEDDFILTFTLEVIKSQGQNVKVIEEKGWWTIKEKKIVYQDYNVPNRKADTFINEVSTFNRYMLLPHHIAQHLYDSEYNQYIKNLNLPPITFTN